VTITQKRYAMVALTVILFASSTTWLLAPFYNHLLVRGPNLISEYESAGMPNATLYRLFDFIGAAALISAVFIRKKTIIKFYGRYVPYILYGVGLLDVIDTITPIRCRVTQMVCNPVLSPVAYIHGTESYLFATTVFGLACYIALKYKKLRWLPIAFGACSLAGYLLHSRLDGVLFGLQSIYTLLQIYLLWFIALGDWFDRPISTTTRRTITRSLALAISLNAVLTILNSLLHLRGRVPVKGLLFTTNTAWLSQHIFLVSITLLILARAIRQGSINAWRAVSCLAFFEIINFSSVTPDIEPLLVFYAIFVTLLMSRKAFDKQHSAVRFVTRLRRSVMVIVITAVCVAVFSGLFHWYYTRQWTRSAFTPSRVVVRTLLIEVRTNPHDPLRAQLFGQVLTATGIFLYSWLFMGLFLPSFIADHTHEEHTDRQDFEALLERFSNNSEDHFKLWPTDKSYWFTNDRSAAVAYQQSGSYAVALADPVCAPRHMSSTIKGFHAYGKSHGINVCWLMVNQSSLEYYKKSHLKQLAIGASAVVDTAVFTQTTVKNKWWRWVRNKSTNQGLVYSTHTPPHSDAMLESLKHLSATWLQQNRHKERTFALGYFDESYLQTCVLHVLTNPSGEVVAFANQVPSHANNQQTTVDLMRYSAGYEGVMAYLLSQVITQVHGVGFKYFDLGFVPLAQLGQQKTTKALFKLSKKALKPVFSMQGLEQFKNKFDPSWQQNYLVWDGDMLDLPLITAAMQKLLTLEGQFNKQ
jgi:phosphatidylglycerol lysyltransferase